ncbi:MAG: glycosyltransferase [Pseudomonadota bacterium]
MDEQTDDPERKFRRWPRARARWSTTTLWRRVRMGARRRRWIRENIEAVAPYKKAVTPIAGGPALALGDFSGASGLSRAALYELDRLRSEWPDLETIDLAATRSAGPALVKQSGHDFGTVLLLSPPDSYPTLLRAVPPSRIANARRIGLWVWETPIFPEDWRFALDVVHEIWTPSEYSRSALAEAAGDIPVTLRAHAVKPPPRVAPFDRSAFGIGEDDFLGVAIMDLCSCPARKNPWAHVAAWQAAFGDDPSRVLLMKLRVSKRTRCVIDELREMIGAAHNIRILEHEFEPEEIAGLQAAADVYLSLHRAEGYGLNIRESLEAGVEVLATDFSANAEYGPAFPNYRPLPWRPTPYRDWTGHYPDGDFTWAEVQIGAAAEELRTSAARWTERRTHPAPGSPMSAAAVRR